MSNIQIKRRKYRDNPYTIFKNMDTNRYYVEFIDSMGILEEIEVNEEVYYAFDRFELNDISEMNKYDRHIEHFECQEEVIYNKTSSSYNLESTAISNIFYSDLFSEISNLPEMQKRRIILYYFYDMKLSEIAELESCTFRAIKFSIDLAVKKLHRNLKNKKSLNIDYKKIS